MDDYYLLEFYDIYFIILTTNFLFGIMFRSIGRTSRLFSYRVIKRTRFDGDSKKLKEEFSQLSKEDQEQVLKVFYYVFIE